MPAAIGICAAVERVRWGPWDADVALTPLSYVRAVQAGGGVALELAPDVQNEPEQILRHLDGLMLAGGRDVDPASYGAEPHPQTDEPRPERDQFEIALIRRAVQRGMPILGICRGMQMLNVALGGTLEQHLPDRIGSDRHRHTLGVFGDHEVRLEPGSLAERAAGAERLAVKSHHHQAVDELAEGLTVSGWSVPDDVVEAVEMPGHPFALGILWHPEEDTRSRVIGALVGAAEREAAAA
jgi:putative glutamine amidotransferase